MQAIQPADYNDRQKMQGEFKRPTVFVCLPIPIQQVEIKPTLTPGD